MIFSTVKIIALLSVVIVDIVFIVFLFTNKKLKEKLVSQVLVITLSFSLFYVSALLSDSTSKDRLIYILMEGLFLLPVSYALFIRYLIFVLFRNNK